jgi:uncharacterized protein involved in copper resistance
MATVPAPAPGMRTPGTAMTTTSSGSRQKASERKAGRKMLARSSCGTASLHAGGVLAPQWFDIEGTLYVGDAGRTAARFQARYELLFTQRLILEPELETNLYGKSDPERSVGSGVSDLEFGLRLRYEIRREFAPYIGLTWTQAFGETADFRRAAGEDASELRAVAGVRVWF